MVIEGSLVYDLQKKYLRGSRGARKAPASALVQNIVQTLFIRGPIARFGACRLLQHKGRHLLQRYERGGAALLSPPLHIHLQ